MGESQLAMSRQESVLPGPGPPLLSITGDRVALGPLRRDLLPLYVKWAGDFEVGRTLSGRFQPLTRETGAAWYQWASQAEDVLFTLYERDAARPIGVTMLKQIDHARRTAMLTLWIGEKERWGQGFGTEATILMLDYGFTALGLHNIMLQVADCDPRGLRAYRRAGFREIGRRRESWRLGDQAYDLILMDCLATEFRSPGLRELLSPAPAGAEVLP
jgi:diamine N-acetyltransferase